MTQFDDDIISGSILKSVWKISWPVIVTQLITGLGGIIDQILVGRYVGFEAQAAVGISWQSFLVLLVFLSSFFHGMNIQIAQYSGRRDSKSVNRVFFETVKASLYSFFFVIAPLGYFLSPFVLEIVTPTQEIYDYALPYLRLLFVATLPLFLMFILNGAFQSVGNPKIPLYFGIITTATKIAVSYTLVSGSFGFPAMGAMGPAVGTCIAPLPSVLIALILIARHKVLIGLPEKLSFRPDMSVLVPIVKLGLPAGLQAVLLNVGGLVLLYYIGTLAAGAEAVAAYTICYGQLFTVVTWVGFGLRAACATVMGQNIGAGKRDRGMHGVYLGVVVGFLWAGFFGIFYWFFAEQLLIPFGLDVHEEPIVVEYATTLLGYLAFSGMFVVMSLAFTGGLQGAGDTIKPMFIAFISQIVVLLGICTVYQLMGKLSTNVIWTAILISHLSRLTMSYIAFASGKWRNINVEIGHDN
ncbi:MAG: MATE family efflux transporter [Candidatus Hydrogenedentota bacterium]